MEITATKGTYKTLTEGLVAPEKRDFDANTAIPESAPNGGFMVDHNQQNLGQIYQLHLPELI